MLVLIARRCTCIHFSREKMVYQWFFWKKKDSLGERSDHRGAEVEGEGGAIRSSIEATITGDKKEQSESSHPFWPEKLVYLGFGYGKRKHINWFVWVSLKWLYIFQNLNQKLGSVRFPKIRERVWDSLTNAFSGSDFEILKFIIQIQPCNQFIPPSRWGMLSSRGERNLVSIGCE